ncbi:hypothetical protein HMPREF0240_04393 [Clostridium sp. D5]|nr:hypothetical protein HMPREF0240_04393 [Clostridium sp. D5]
MMGISIKQYGVLKKNYSERKLIMVERELLNAISDMMDSKFEEFKVNLATKDDIANMATKDDIANMATKDDIACIWKEMANLATKADLREVENNVLTEVDRVQEIATSHYNEVKMEISQLRAEVRSYQIGSLKLRVDRLEGDMIKSKR